MEFIAAKLGWIDRATPKVYLCQISQTATLKPGTKVYKNTLTNSATWSKTATNTYTLRFVQNVMPSATKTHIDVRFTPKATTAASDLMRRYRVVGTRSNASTVTVTTFDGITAAASTPLSGARTAELEIRVYK